ncbi:alpha/beta hydrolase family protein [Thioalkalivibrio paradoxus]|uniref:Alpha/beta hydrolase n=1 Tax=Thioalkalivibrio paradoxus ARh 1 TaxID=713585 RepID=W0DK89_9GAMM|nr:alpha/beta fold hydrolase [Thioalkalivibrio paradoxus]AHE97300.1 alpha/beta hydrolase [Thioalkalivibrio paradoxus ARh 1]
MGIRNKALAIDTPRGIQLSGVVVEPEGIPVGQACIAHCFACSKDFPATVRLARALALEGIIVLRFDFMGLGEAQGRFVDSSFETYCEDLGAALDAFDTYTGFPTDLLIGHSFGGAMALALAGNRDELRGVVTIAAPAEPGHVTRLFEARAHGIRETGSAEVDIGGRRITIGREFMDSVEDEHLDDALPALGRPLLVLHSPKDSVVGIDHARRIFERARHPKSFVALHRADHLLTRPEHTAYVARLIHAWADDLLRPHQ